MTQPSTNTSPDYDVLPTRVGYDRWSTIYDAEDNPLVRLEESVFKALLGEIHGLALLDVGCGTGRWANCLADQGAKVVAVDFSEGMLRKARAKPSADRVRFVCHDLAQPLPFTRDTFDRVISCLVMDHVARPADLFAEMARVCRADGRIVVTVMHPAMMLQGVSARFTDPQSGRQIRPMSERNQISDYVMAAVRAGLVFEHIGEYAVDEALTQQSPRAAKHLGWPLLLTMRLRMNS